MLSSPVRSHALATKQMGRAQVSNGMEVGRRRRAPPMTRLLGLLVLLVLIAGARAHKHHDDPKTELGAVDAPEVEACSAACVTDCAAECPYHDDSEAGHVCTESMSKEACLDNCSSCCDRACEDSESFKEGSCTPDPGRHSFDKANCDIWGHCFVCS